MYMCRTIDETIFLKMNFKNFNNVKKINNALKERRVF